LEPSTAKQMDLEQALVVPFVLKSERAVFRNPLSIAYRKLVVHNSIWACYICQKLSKSDSEPNGPLLRRGEKWRYLKVRESKT